METTKHKTISIKWSTDDILGQAENMDVKISTEEANEILDRLERRHDACLGINWDVITNYIQECIDDKEI